MVPPSGPLGVVDVRFFAARGFDGSPDAAGSAFDVPSSCCGRFGSAMGMRGTSWSLGTGDDVTAVVDNWDVPIADTGTAVAAYVGGAFESAGGRAAAVELLLLDAFLLAFFAALGSSSDDDPFGSDILSDRADEIAVQTRRYCCGARKGVHETGIGHIIALISEEYGDLYWWKAAN